MRFKVVKAAAPPDTMQFETSHIFWPDMVVVDVHRHRNKEYYNPVLFVQVVSEKDHTTSIPGVFIFLLKNLKESVLTKRIFSLFSALKDDCSDFSLALMICLYHRAKEAIFKTKLPYHWVRKHRLPRPLGELYHSFFPGQPTDDEQH